MARPTALEGGMQMTEDRVALLRRAIDRSGLSVDKFARTVVVRDKGTVYRWLRGEVAVPDVVVAKLKTVRARKRPKG